MDDIGWLIAGYGVTATTIVVYLRVLHRRIRAQTSEAHEGPRSQ